MTQFDNYQTSLDLASEGNYLEALEHIQQHLRSNPDDGEAWNDAGAILYGTGKASEATQCLQRAKELIGESGQLYLNLFHAHLAADQCQEAAGLFEKMSILSVLDRNIITECSEAFAKKGDPKGAMEVMRIGKQFLPEEMQPLVFDEQDDREPTKIAFFCGGDGATFLGDIHKFAKEHFQVRIFEGGDQQQLNDLMKWSDISWFEWCTNLAVIGTQLPKVCKTIVRLHRYEAYTDWARQVNWDNVDTLITVGNRHVDKVLERQVPGISTRTNMVGIPNGVDLAKFGFTDKGRGKNIGFVANLRMVKNPMLLLQCIKQLTDIDNEYKLFMVGKSLQIEVENYLKHMITALGLENNVFWEGWRDDMDNWFGDKHYIVSTSIIESQGMGILEGMARGLKPVIHNFPGAEGTFTDKYLFNTVGQFCEQVLSESYDPLEYRQFVEEKYPLSGQLRRITGVLEGLGARIPALTS